MELSEEKILIIGASGFVGHSLLREFEREQIPVRCLLRTPRKVAPRSSKTQLVQGDLLKIDSLRAAVVGIDVIYFLAHALDEAHEKFESIEQQQAENLAQVCTTQQRIIFLGGLGSGELSPHLKSRQKVGAILASGKASVIELRASIIIGEGSFSFEMARAICHRLPFIVTAKWSKVACQPMSVHDLMKCLILTKNLPLTEHHRIIEIGGKDQILYQDILKTYCQLKGLVRPVLDIPLLPKKVIIDSLPYIVPEFAVAGAKLLESIEIVTVVSGLSVEEIFGFSTQNLEESIRTCMNSYTPVSEDEQFEIMKQLKKSSQFSQYLKGAELLEFYDLPYLWDKHLDLTIIVDKMRGPLSLIPGLSKLGSWDWQAQQGRLVAHLNFPLMGAFRFEIFHPQETPQVLRMVLGFRPKFFFEAAPWALYHKMSRIIFHQVEKLLKPKERK